MASESDKLAYALEQDKGGAEMATLQNEAGEDGKDNPEDSQIYGSGNEPRPMRVTSESGILEEQSRPQDDSVNVDYIVKTNDNDDGFIPQDDYKNNDHPEDEYKNLVDTVVSRNWFVMFQFTMLGAYVGLVIYIITGNQDYIWYMGGTFCAIAFGIDTLTPKDYKTTKIWTDSILRHEHEPEWDANDSEDIEFPLRSEFYDYKGHLAGVTTVYQVGQSPADRSRKSDIVNVRNGKLSKEDINDPEFEEELKVSGLQYGMSNADNINKGKIKGISDAPDGYLSHSSDLMSVVSNMGDYRTLAVRQRRIFSQMGYKGYETGGGIASAIGTVLSVVITFLRYGGFINILSDDWFKTEGAQILTWILFIVFFMFIIMLIGCMIELELRRQNYLYPIGWSYEEMEWFPVYEIIDWSYESIGFYTTDNTDDPKGTCAKLAYKWFKLMLGFIAFIFKAIVVILVLIFRNPPFGLWTLVTCSMGFAYYAHIDKDHKALDPALVFCIISFVVSIILIIAVNKGSFCTCKCCGKTREIPTVAESRVEGKTQKKCKIIFVICSILLFLAMILLIAAISDFHKTEVEVGKASSLWKQVNCRDYFDAKEDKEDAKKGSSELTFTPSPVVNGTFRTTIGTGTDDTFDTDTDTDENTFRSSNSTRIPLRDVYPLCPQYGSILTLVVLLSITWCILWICSIIWYYVDTLTFNVLVKEQKDVFREFAKFKIKRRLYGDLQQKSYQSNWSGAWFMWLFGGTQYKVETMFVSVETAISLHKHLTKVTRMLRFNESILINPWLPYILPPTGAPRVAPVNEFGSFIAGSSVQPGYNIAAAKGGNGARGGKNNNS